ncbi:MAG TPA: bifunctional 2-C-methyl-D-erythritol 4-phosphate cytidylyltransferase/2-C-methyl-D-erythritol 2,4-cyclodiphosphate synthase [Caulobacteraceae bacterium]|jgi:2-C-methyl-D-erythritol 4-phosphate cytidylyltransferase/2-C-methyl-D-erythritol 2,4-cyclodiphosphate synthase|nr:bifunctional 2-C-methyl-D-erythritol 4-phosphate cytidylyltransferase/2-C-methyl-D-erythritol 2,4-cyclodiphosphate synthase [Caulobacteraceae bacterium]
MKFAAVIVAAGSGARAGAEAPKQWRSLAGRAVARWSLEALLAAGAQTVVVVIRPGDQALAEKAFSGLSGWTAVAGGAERIESVRAGLARLGGDFDAVLIHDAARPFVTAAHVGALLAALEAADGAVPAIAVADTLKRNGNDGAITAPRDGLFGAQTPQAFRRAALTAAYAAWPKGEVPTDDAAVVERAGGRVVLTAGDPMLMKLTYPEDFVMAERLAGAARITRTGFGYDAHRFGPGAAVWLCGVEIPHDKALVGHSDADAGLHALTDAILGAIGEGDIGDHFPPSDPQWRGVSSDRFLRHAAGLAAARGGRLVNVDVTLVCERPKIKPHREAMRARLAEILDLPLDRVSVKATTTEGMGFAGREEGLAAQAVATVEMPG